MGAIFFYHLTRRPLEAVLPDLLGKARGQGWRVEVRGTDPARLDWLDEKLWLGPEDGFLPHGLAGGPHDALQPILLTTSATPGFDCVMSVDGAALEPEEVQRLERACILFDGNDPHALDTARDQWRSLTGSGCAAQYWSEEAGRWEKKRETGG